VAYAYEHMCQDARIDLVLCLKEDYSRANVHLFVNLDFSASS